MALVSLTPSLAKFSPGQVVMTSGVECIARERNVNLMAYLHRHVCGDWGHVCKADAELNNDALKLKNAGFSSAYRLESGHELWIITEYGRSVTTLLLPSEY